MNVTGNRNYVPIDYKSVVKNIPETLPVKEEETKQNDFLQKDSGVSDQQRELLASYMGYQSKVDQIDIYLRSSTNGKMKYDGVFPDVQAFNDMQNRMKISDVYA